MYAGTSSGLRPMPCRPCRAAPVCWPVPLPPLCRQLLGRRSRLPRARAMEVAGGARGIAPRDRLGPCSPVPYRLGGRVEQRRRRVWTGGQGCVAYETGGAGAGCRRSGPHIAFALAAPMPRARASGGRIPGVGWRDWAAGRPCRFNLVKATRGSLMCVNGLHVPGWPAEPPSALLRAASRTRCRDCGSSSSSIAVCAYTRTHTHTHPHPHAG